MFTKTTENVMAGFNKVLDDLDKIAEDNGAKAQKLSVEVTYCEAEQNVATRYATNIRKMLAGN